MTFDRCARARKTVVVVWGQAIAQGHVVVTAAAEDVVDREGVGAQRGRPDVSAMRTVGARTRVMRYRSPPPRR